MQAPPKLICHLLHSYRCDNCHQAVPAAVTCIVMTLHCHDLCTLRMPAPPVETISIAISASVARGIFASTKPTCTQFRVSLASVPLSGQCARTALKLPIVPVGTSRAASLPMILAAYSCSLFTVGSSPYTSSPTSA